MSYISQIDWPIYKTVLVIYTEYCISIFDNLTWIANKYKKKFVVKNDKNEIFCCSKRFKITTSFNKKFKTFIKIDNFNNFVESKLKKYTKIFDIKK